MVTGSWPKAVAAALRVFETSAAGSPVAGAGTVALAPERLYQACDPALLGFHTTAELEDLHEVLGQARAMGALEFGVGIRHEGYNLYVMGSPGLGKHGVVGEVLEHRAAGEATPSDWCYVHNFRAPHKPRALRLPAGMGAALQHELKALVRALLTALPVALESDEHRARVQQLKEEFKAREEREVASLSGHARAMGIMVIRTPMGYTIAPARDGEVLGSDDFDKLPAEDRERFERQSGEIRELVRQTVERVSAWQRELEARTELAHQEVARAVVDRHVGELAARYRGRPDIGAFLDEVRRDVGENVDEFRRYAAENKAPPNAGQRLTPFNRYYLNVLVDNGAGHGAPVVREDHPTFQNLVGRTEHLAQFGTLLTDFTLIKAGALHRANGGYLVLDARKVLSHAFAWDALKRALRAREIRIQSLEQMMSLGSTISLEPEPIPLDLKVVLVGDRLLYDLLSHYDPEFPLLFKVELDFSEDLERTPESTRLYARLIATLQRREKLRPMDCTAVGRLIEHAARRADDGGKLSLHLESLLDVLREADYWARGAASDVVRVEHVERAIAERIHRADQMRERLHEAILRRVLLIDTAGARAGQVNGLAVSAAAGHRFGHPVRITATARLGTGHVVDIEREVELGGPSHSKGVLILSAYLASRYSHDEPLSLAASVVFEQSYQPVEGDSASLAELCALVSAIAGLPLRQDLAVTGSVNQHGAVQAIGGVNEKIEGFFDICRARGLEGTQGVVIPEANVRHLMLRRDVVEAVASGRFHVHAVRHVDEAMRLLAGMPAGEMAADGAFPEGTVNGAAQRHLRELARRRREFGAGAGGGAKEPATR